ncbi:MAG: hypothetical protein WDN49_07915 [Acetobacteraceae bacterium]
MPESMAGVYKHRFANGLVTGEKFQSEDVLEIVPYQAGAAYFRIHSEFYNGHMCDIAGIATASADHLTYDGPKDDSGAACTLTIRQARDGIHIYENENLACKNQTCGARGGYGFRPDGAPDFKLTDRRPIRYLQRLLASSEYASAVKDYTARPH